MYGNTGKTIQILGVIVIFIQLEKKKNTQNNPLLIGTLVDFKIIQHGIIIIGVSKCKGSQVTKILGFQKEKYMSVPSPPPSSSQPYMLCNFGPVSNYKYQCDESLPCFLKLHC